MEEKPELLLCPFCGSRAEMNRAGKMADVFFVACTNPACGVEICDTAENVVELWNTRVDNRKGQE